MIADDKLKVKKMKEKILNSLKNEGGCGKLPTMMERKRTTKKSKISYGAAYLLVLLTGLLVVLFALFITDRFRTSAEPDCEVNQEAVALLKSLEDRDVGEVVSGIKEKKYLIESSIKESQSVSESESMSKAMEESSIEASAYESSVQASKKADALVEIADLLEGSHLTAGKVSYELDDTDIPYLRNLFSNCIVIGNSRAKNAVDCGIFSEQEIKFQSGVAVDVIKPFALEVAKLYAPKTLFVMGLNDIGHFDGSNEKFYEAYKDLVLSYQAINPDSVIYLQEILPVPDEAVDYFYRYFMIPDFNARIKQVCEETGCIYVSATPYADFKYINSEDHAHYGKDFYFLWAQTIANQMHLWEDMAGLDDEIEWEEG